MGTARVRVSFTSDESDRSYDVLIRDGILDELKSGSIDIPQATSYFIVTDSNVGRLYAKDLRAGLSRGRGRVETVTFPAGEANKNIHTVSVIAARLGKLGADRRSVLFALGGGVVGDLTGFVASIYKRGIRYIQVPTTLLAQVDSSIGGKTGVDAPWGKNQLGTFHQPVAVFADPLLLRTLPPREFLNGFAEIVKCAIVADRPMFNRLTKMTRYDFTIPRGLIADACRIKAGIVSRDERERNLRAVLNYGHTVGHAIESASAYTLGHGASVILGMLAEGWVALRLGVFDENDFETQLKLLKRLSKDIGRKPRFDKKTILKFAAADKKASSSQLRMSLPARIGKMHSTKEGNYNIPVSSKTVGESIDYLNGIISSS